MRDGAELWWERKQKEGKSELGLFEEETHPSLSGIPYLYLSLLAALMREQGWSQQGPSLRIKIMVTLAVWTPPSIQRSASWLCRWLMMLMSLRSWVHTWQWTLCQGWASLHCVTKEHPGNYTLCRPALSDQAAVTQMEAVMTTGPRRARAGAGFTIPTPG